VTLNDLERRNDYPLFRVISHNSIALQADYPDYVTVVEDSTIMSAKYRFPGHLAKTDPRSSRTVCLRELSFLI